MKREEILFYMSEGKVHLYLVNAKREKVFEIDTSLFFEFGEISNVALCENKITELLTKMKLGDVFFKPNFIVLYNDVCHCDLKFLYMSIFRDIGYNSVKFVRLSKIARQICSEKNAVVYDKTYYTFVERGEKSVLEEMIGSEAIIIGKRHSQHVHYSEEDIIWRTFKTYFTNPSIYDNMDVGDD